MICPAPISNVTVTGCCSAQSTTFAIQRVTPNFG
jgi:hypothetical protein